MVAPILSLVKACQALIACLMIFVICQAPAATWYAAVGGRETAGTYDSPWSVEFAVSSANNLLRPGDIVVFRDGTFKAPAPTNVLHFGKSGAPTAKITYKPENLWGFSVDGGLKLQGSVSNVVLQGLRIFCSSTTNRNNTNYNDFPAGIEEFGEGNEILHNLVENTGHPAIASWKSTKGKYIAGNILRFAGYDDWNNGSLGTRRGNGMYLQNAEGSAEALIQGNISYYQYTTGMKAYGNTDVSNFKFRNNVCVQNEEGGLFYHLDNHGSKGVQIISNYTWDNGPGIRLGYVLGNGGHSNAVVIGNYVVDNGTPFEVVDGWSNMIWTNNISVNLYHKYMWRLEVANESGGFPESHNFNNNRYWAKDYSPFHGEPFAIREGMKTWEQWKAEVQGDSNSSFSFGQPSSTAVYDFQPSRIADFVYVTVFNWSSNKTATLDVSKYFKPGDKLKIFDAQNIPFSYTNFSYAGGSIQLDLSLTAYAKMCGVFSKRSAPWAGFDPRFRAFVIYRFGTDSLVNIPEAPRMKNAGPI